MTIATAPKSSSNRKSESLYKRLHVIIPIEDMLWASQQKPSVTQLWQECWTADPYGSRWMSLNTTLGYSTFICAKKVLSETGLFIFKPDKSIQDGRETVGWMVRNLHGSRMKDFWEEVDSLKQEPDSTKQEANSQSTETRADSEKIRASNQASISTQPQSQQAIQKPSRTSQQHLTNSSKEFVRCDSDTLAQNYREDETAHAPLGGASPSPGISVSESEEELSFVTDCTTKKALVDEQEGQSALPIAENKDSGVEPRDCHEGLSSAAPAVLPLQNLTNTEILDILDAANQGVCPSKEAIAVLLETRYARSLMGAITNNPQWGINLSHYSTVPQDFTQNSKLRSERLNRLKSYAANCECPPDEFLLECQSDPVLRIQLSRLAARENWDIQKISTS